VVYVVVIRAPASGKYTLSMTLAPALGVHLLAKDTIKFALVDASVPLTWLLDTRLRDPRLPDVTPLPTGRLASPSPERPGGWIARSPRARMSDDGSPAAPEDCLVHDQRQDAQNADVTRGPGTWTGLREPHEKVPAR
jgi:hypothetical protein